MVRIARFAATFILLVGTVLSANAQTMLAGVLAGTQEVPVRITPASGFGVGFLTGNAGSYVFNYTLNYTGLTGTLSDAHIHNAAAGTNGPVVHGLDGLAANIGTTSGVFTGDWRFDDATRPLTDTLATALLNGNTYFNVHTNVFPGGEIRGQLSVVPEPGTVALTLAGLLTMGGVYLRRVRK